MCFWLSCDISLNTYVLASSKVHLGSPPCTPINMTWIPSSKDNASLRSNQNESIFRLLLKVAVIGALIAKLFNFWKGIFPNATTMWDFCAVSLSVTVSWFFELQTGQMYDNFSSSYESPPCTVWNLIGRCVSGNYISLRSNQNESIFRLLLKVAVIGALTAKLFNFWQGIFPNVSWTLVELVPIPSWGMFSSGLIKQCAPCHYVTYLSTPMQIPTSCIPSRPFGYDQV